MFSDTAPTLVLRRKDDYGYLYGQSQRSLGKRREGNQQYERIHVSDPHYVWKRPESGNLLMMNRQEKTMSDVPIQVIVAAFNDEKSADAALQDLKQATKQGLIGIQNAAILRRDEQGKLHIKETADMKGGKGAVVGGVIGAVAGLIAGPFVLVTAAGAIIGGLAAKLRDSGFPDARLREIGEGLTPGSSAIIAVIEHRWVAEVQRMMAEAGAQVMTEALKEDLAAQLEAQQVPLAASGTESTVIADSKDTAGPQT